MLNRRKFLTAASAAYMASCSRVPRLRISSHEGVEGLLLGEIAGVTLERKLSAQIERRLGLGNSAVLYQAIQGRDLDLYAEYSRVAYKSLFKTNDPTDPAMSTEKLRKEFREKCQSDWLNPLGFESIIAVVVRTDDPTFANIKTLSEAGQDKVGFKLGCNSDFSQAPEGYQALKQAYQIPERVSTRIEPLGQLYFGLNEKRIDMLVTMSTDPRLIDKSKYRVLTDDMNVFSPNRASLVVRLEILEKHPEVVPVLNALSGKFTNEGMQKLNAEVELNRRSISEVALEWAQKNGVA
jgi:glycine betaine/choline ABC-type transport system substrate-binding protein